MRTSKLALRPLSIAEQGFLDIIEYLAAENLSAAHRLTDHIEKRLRELQSHEYDKPNLDIVKSIIWNLAKKRPRK